eukprot:gnl/TRDRNA2_/TRDRNA2_175329_c0_seq1.p1 gnl/TRDRNA2_/TRDRNA2_175329_c0~~gnl/TRDRNA2_/TRDRNA2_175329_c0_seq1.p1  ORF type:complete len:381 (+),score=96.46 gnl/TRDRNA2_/TRDRNA2_175329_c0_seq1:61-1203(+)
MASTRLPALAAAVSRSAEKARWVARAEKRIGKQAWLATVPWYSVSTAGTVPCYNVSPPTVAVPMSEAQCEWLANAQKRIGKQAWLATMPLYNATECQVHLPQTIASCGHDKEQHADFKPVAKADIPSPQASAGLLSEKWRWLVTAEKHAGKQKWLDTMPWYKALKAETSSPLTVAVSLTDTQRKWLAKAEKRIGKQAWLATTLLQKEMQSPTLPRMITSVADEMELHTDTKPLAEADTSLLQPVPVPLSEAQRKWLAKAETRVGKQTWLATMPLYASMHRQALPQTIATTVDEKELSADMKTFTEAQYKWLAKAEKHAGKKAWLATMPWYKALVESKAHLDSKKHLQHLFPAQMIQCIATVERPILGRPGFSAPSADISA